MESCRPLRWGDIQKRRREVRERAERDRRILLGVAAGAFAASIAYGVATSKSGPEMIGTVLGTGFVLLVETWALTFVSRRLLPSPVETWRVAVLAVLTVALDVAERLALDGRGVGIGARIAAMAAECFVLAVIAQSVLPSRFGRALAVAVLARLLATGVYLLILLAVLGALLALIVR